MSFIRVVKTGQSVSDRCASSWSFNQRLFETFAALGKVLTHRHHQILFKKERRFSVEVVAIVVGSVKLWNLAEQQRLVLIRQRRTWKFVFRHRRTLRIIWNSETIIFSRRWFKSVTRLSEVAKIGEVVAGTLSPRWLTGPVRLMVIIMLLRIKKSGIQVVEAGIELRFVWWISDWRLRKKFRHRIVWWRKR